MSERPLKDQLLHVHDELTKAIFENKSIQKSVFGVFHKNFDRYYLKMNPKLLSKSKTLDIKALNLNGILQTGNDISAEIDKEITYDEKLLKLKNKLHFQMFKDSKILKRDVDKAMMYYNLPEYLIMQMFIPTRLFPNKDADKFPLADKILEYFDSKQNRKVPNLILIEI